LFFTRCKPEVMNLPWACSADRRLAHIRHLALSQPSQRRKRWAPGLCTNQKSLLLHQVRHAAPEQRMHSARLSLLLSAAFPRLLPALATPDVRLTDLIQLETVEDLLVVCTASLIEHEP